LSTSSTDIIPLSYGKRKWDYKHHSPSPTTGKGGMMDGYLRNWLSV
jgi:hypothetical protein